MKVTVVQLVLVLALLVAFEDRCKGASLTHITIGENEDGSSPLKLFTAGPPTLTITNSGHPGLSPPGSIFGATRLSVSSNSGVNGFKAPQFGGFTFGTKGVSDMGLDFAPAAGPFGLTFDKLPGPPLCYTLNIKRLQYSDPAELALYGTTGLPELLEDDDEYDFGTAGSFANCGVSPNFGHVHPFWLMRRPGVVQWDIQLTSDQWLPSDPYTYYFTTVPGRGTLVPIDMSAVFNADVVDSDMGDSPTSFDSGGNVWLLNGLYGTGAGLPVDGLLYGFQLGGPSAAGLQGSNSNALFDNGTLSLGATVDLVTAGQDDAYLSVEFLIGGAGTFTDADVINVTFEYSDASTQMIDIKRTASAIWHAHRPMGNWEQVSMPRPQLAIGPNGDRTAGFARSTGSGVDAGAGENFFFFRAPSIVDRTKTLTEIQIADYTGTNRVGIFGIVAIKQAPLEITTVSLPDAMEGEPYSLAVAAEGTPPFKNWSATGLPAGLSINMDTGVISGTSDPGTSAGSPYSVVIFVDDSINDFDPSFPPETAMTTISLSVVPGMIPGDINDDGLVNEIDIGLFIDVLVGTETNPDYVMRSDINGVDGANGADIQPFLATLGL